MDDVGQTLLNWAAAFGTYEMVCTSHTAPSPSVINNYGHDRLHPAQCIVLP